MWPTPGETLRELGLKSRDTIAEIGSGNGYFALPAARVAAPASVYALDIDDSLLAELSQIAALQGIENLITINGDARQLSAQLPEPVDVVLMANTFHGIDETAAFVQQAFESLHPGGRFVVINWEDSPREATTIRETPRGPPTELRLSPETTEQTVLDTAGFVLEATVDLPPYHYALVFKREYTD
ncbi:class I SAM-dependent methyltransferase [Haloarcula nitratireducens]|uniref:class I SAM-dependent methyltransferase n=1 Tax=Haloarcula nitratireducens TaxID=2487749 RepID=UPI002E280148|nr:class I SAM-dependent methyltransferase [Halomicroarcula nitratireducens]